ncbi:MAG: NAD(P)/FAD-dependent oxidoreductase [Bacteroidota bacterium]
MTEKKTITINGAGLVGSLLAILLAKKGYEVVIYDMRPDPRETKALGGRSINLALSNRGWLALEKAGIAQEIKQKAIPMKGRMMHNTDGKLTFQPYGKSGQAIFSVSRSGLNQTLIEQSSKLETVRYQFDKKCTSVDLDASTLYFTDTNTQKTLSTTYNYLIGSDGAFSPTRAAMQRKTRFNYSQEFLTHGYKELHIPATPEGDFALEPNALHIWPRKQFMLIALPNADKSFTATLFLAFEGRTAFENLQTTANISAFFEQHFPDTLPIIPALVEQFQENPTSSLVTIKCQPWLYHNTLLIGDASHAIVPFYGQGMNSGFEDCYLLDDMLENAKQPILSVFDEFQKQRKKDADAIAELALQNFIEMRDLVADKDFLLRKKIEARLHELYPSNWMPLYSMVTFSHIPYSEALKVGQKQQTIMNDVMQLEGIENNWETIDFSNIKALKQYFT